MAKKYLYLNFRDEFLRVDISKIVFFEADGNYTSIVFSNRTKGIVCMNLSRMQSLLSEKLREAAMTFARVGKSHIVNLDYVHRISITRQKLTLSDGERFEFGLDVSKEALKKLRDLFVASAGNRLHLNGLPDEDGGNP